MNLTLDERLAIVRRFRHRLAADAAAFATAASGLLQTPVAEGLAAEVLPLADACRFLEREAAGVLAPRRLGSRGRPVWLFGVALEIRREPLGRVLLVGAHNYPLLLVGVQALQALVAGNTVLLKPGRGGAPAARALAEGLFEAGLPRELLQVLDESPDSARAVIAAGVAKVVLTGSAATGRTVMGELASHGTPSIMELSGCDACLVLEGADLDRVVRSIAFSLRLKGSATCIASRRVIGSARALAAIEAPLIEAARSVPERRVTPDVAERVKRVLEGAIADGARLAAGRGDGSDLMPAIVVADARPGMPILREDLFAPIVTLVPVDGEDAAVETANACPFALGASVFGPSSAARRVAARLEVGCVTINDVIAPTGDPRLPFGGRGASGFGVTRGAEGLLEMTAIKAVATRHGRMVQHLDPEWMEDEPLLTAYLRAAHAAGWRQRAMAAGTLAGALARRLSTKPKSSP